MPCPHDTQHSLQMDLPCCGKPLDIVPSKPQDPEGASTSEANYGSPGTVPLPPMEENHTPMLLSSRQSPTLKIGLGTNPGQTKSTLKPYPRIGSALPGCPTPLFHSEDSSRILKRSLWYSWLLD